MTQLYSSYLLRWWHVGRGLQRFEVQHIQSGERIVVTSLEEATAWIGARAPRPEADGATTQDRQDEPGI